MKKIRLLLALGLMVLGAMMNSVSAQEIGAWKGFKSGAATFTFLQNAPCHVTYVAPLFDSYGYEASFYVVTGTVTNWSDWQTVADNGHEIGSYGMTNTASINESELIQSKSVIDSHITGQNCITVCYPNCQRPQNTGWMSNYFIAGSDCRNRVMDGSNLGMEDPYLIPKIKTGDMGINSTAQITSKMQEAINSKGWAVFMTFGIQGQENGNATYSPTSSDALRGALQWAEENGKIWVSSLRNVEMYACERFQSTFALQSETTTAATYTLTHSMNTTVCDYDYPLSLRVPLQGWTDIEVKQNGNVIEHTVNGDYIYFDAVPNGGTIVISHAPAAFKEIYAVKDGTKMVLYYDSQKASRANVIAGWTPENGTNDMSSTERDVFTSVELDASMQAARPTSTSRWFYSLMNVTRITHLNYLNTSNVTNMSSMFDQCQTLAWLDVSGFDIAKVTSMYNMFNGCRLLNMIYCENDWSLSPKLTSTNTMSMFYGCSQLYGDRGTRYDNAHTDFTYALPDGKDDKPGYFSRKGLETYITIVGSKLTLYYDNRFTERDGASDKWYPDMGTNFLPSAEKAAVTEIEIDASVQNYQPTTTQSWFSGLNNATTITGLNNLNTSKVTNMSSMFSGCSSLTSLDLNSFDVSNLKNTSYMFHNCSALTTIYCNESWYAKGKITSSDNMFNGCVSLVGGLGTTYAASNPNDKTYAEPDMISGYPGYFTANGPVIYAVMEGSKMVVYYDANYGAREGRITDWWPEVEGAEGTYHMSNEAKAAVTEIEIDASLQNYQPTTTHSWFSNLRNATTITGLNYLNTSKVKNMTAMFSGCSSLTSLDLSGFNTANVTNMSGMFSNCSSLTTLNLSSFNTAKVTDMDDMFLNCARLTSLDLKNFNVSSLLNANRMFYGCSALTTIESNRDWNGIVYASAMFEGCTSLVGGNGTAYSAEHTDKTYARPDGGSSQPGYFTGELILPEIYAVKDGTKMVLYYDTQKSSRANVIANWTPEKGALEVSGTEKVNVTEAELDASMQAARPTSTKYWFGGFNHMTSIAHLDYLNTSEATTMKGMFTTCLSLTSLDLSSFNTANVTEMDYMFSGCSSLTTIKCNNDWSASSVLEDSENMFDGCTSLVGGKGTAYDAAHKDATYARPDNGASEPGYFTSTETEPEIYAAMDGTKMVLYYDDQKESRENVIANWTEWNGTHEMSSDEQDFFTAVELDESMQAARPTSLKFWFYSMGNVTEIVHLDYLNTSEVTDMSHLFNSCGVRTLDLSSFNTDKVTTMQAMFNQCSVVALNISSFNTSNVTDMSYMFSSCWNLTELNITHFNTAKVRNMEYMFHQSRILELDLQNFSVARNPNMTAMFERSHVTTIYCNEDWSQTTGSDSWMFEDSKSLVGGNGTKWSSENPKDKTYARPDKGASEPGYFTTKKTGKYVYTLFDEKAHELTYYYDDQYYNEVERPGIIAFYDPTDMRFDGYNNKVFTIVIDESMKEAELTSTANMFFELKNASEIEGLENLVTDKVTNMSSMFWACEFLSDLDLTSFNTSNVTNMTGMFQYCYNMQTLDLSSFDLSNLDRAREMFSNCGVKTIYCTQDLSAQSLKEKNNMFSYSSVVGGKGTVLDSRYESNEYARPDGGVERPGYFTLPTEEALIDGVNYLLDNKTLTAEVIALPEGKYEEEVLIPEKVKYFVKEYTVTGIGDEAFKDCDGLTSLTLESTTPLEVGEGAFEGVPKDIAIYVPDESKSLYEKAEGWKEFEDFRFTTIVIDGICYELDPNTYYAKVVALPQGKYKGNIVLPEEVTFEGVKYKVGQIGKGAFARCGELESLSLPATINEIEDMAIVGNPRLISINVAELNLKYSDKEGVLFNASGNTLLIYPTGRYGGYSVPEGTKRIEHHAFIGADLKMMFLPESLEEIGSFAFDQTSLLWMGIKANTPPAADDMAFYGVNNMIPIYVPDESIESYRDAKEWKEFSNIVKGIVRNVGIGDLIYDLYRWDNTAEVVGTVEDNPTGMIEIPEQIEVAFELAGVPARRTDAAHMPQGGEPTPSSVKYRVVSIGKEAFYLKTRLGGVTIPGSVKTIGEYAFYGCTKLSFAHFNEGLEEVKDCAFAKCLNIHNWDFPKSLVTIGSHAFAGSAVEDLYIPDNVQYIHGYAFLDCRDLKWAEIGEGVRFMGDCVFKNCTELLALYMNGLMPPSVGKNMFHEAGKIQTIYAPCGALERYQEAWKDYAKYIKNEEFSLWYTITAEPSEHGTILVPMTDCNHNMVAIPDKGYHFVEWSDGNTENPRELERPTSNISYGAVFEANIYKWEVDANNADWGYVSTPRVEKEYPYGTEMTAIAVPKDGYKFIKWSNGKQITPFNFTLEKDTFLRAIFIEEDKEPEIPQFTMQVTSAEIKWWKKDDAFFYSLAVYLDEAMTNLFATFLFDKNGYIVDVVLPTQAPRRAMKEEQETEFQYTISGLSADTKYYYRMETRDESERLIYTDEGEFRTLTTEVYIVIARIDAIGEVELTDQCGSRIESAREAYDALSEENKALVTNYETLVADEKQYEELKKAAEAAALADAKEQLAATLIELQAVKALAGQYEAVDIETAVTDAIIAANAILNSDEVTSQEVYAANATAQSELTTALMDLLDMAKKQLDDALSALLEEGDSEACQQIIAEAIEAVDLLEIDWTKTVEANATDIATNGQAIYDQALADLEAQRKAEQEPTGLEQTSTNDEWQMKNFHATKVMENGVLYLLHEGRMYNVQGQRVK